MKRIIGLLLTALLIVSCSSLKDAEAEYEAEEKIVNIKTATHEIPATVCIPKTDKEVPFVIMLHGTGSNRDEAGGGYKVAAPILAKKFGIATIRIDFMGNGDSKADYRDYNFTSAVADAMAAKEYMCSLEGIAKDKCGIMGWSQGGTIALLAAGRYPSEFQSVITWAGAPDLSLLVTKENYDKADKDGYFVMEFGWRSSLNVGKEWCDNVRNTDVLREFSSYQGPVLAIAGKQDTTVDPEWSNKIVRANRNRKSQVYFIAGMDHTFNVFAESDYATLTKAVYKTGEFFKSTL